MSIIDFNLVSKRRNLWFTWREWSWKNHNLSYDFRSLWPTSGEITWDGQKIRMNQLMIFSVIYLKNEHYFEKLTVKTQVSYLAMLKGMSEDKTEKELDAWLEKFNISDYKNKKIKELSKGNQQKVQFICAVIHNPELIILDEPFTGLDPINLEMMKEEIINFKNQGKTIIFSSHRMEHIETLCDRLTILRKGRTVLQGQLKEIKQSYNARTILIQGKLDADYLKSIPHVGRSLASKTIGASELIINSIPQPSSML